MLNLEKTVLEIPILDTQLFLKTFKNGYSIDSSNSLIWWFSQDSNTLHY